jgi:hypothetical protein
MRLHIFKIIGQVDKNQTVDLCPDTIEITVPSNVVPNDGNTGQDYKTLSALKLYHDTMVRDQCDTFFTEGVHLYFVEDSSASVSLYLMWSKMCEWLKYTYFVKEFTSYSSFVEYNKLC